MQYANGAFQILNNTSNIILTTSNNNGDTYIDTRNLYYKKPGTSPMHFTSTNTETGNAYNYVLKGHPAGDTDSSEDALRIWCNGTAYSSFTSKSSVIDNPIGDLYIGAQNQDLNLWGDDIWVGPKVTNAISKTLSFWRAVYYFADMSIGGGAIANGTLKSCIMNSPNLHIDSAHTNHIYLNFYNSYGLVYLKNSALVSSDERCKKNIKIIDDDEALNKILEIETVTYNMIEDEDDVKHYGFIAQSVEKIFPHAVSSGDGYTCEIMETFDFVYEDIKNDKGKVKTHKLTIDTDILEDGQKYRIRYGGYEREYIAVVVDGITTMTTENVLEFNKPLKMKIIGKCINDFKRLRQEDIFCLHNSGIQQIHKNNVALKEEVASLRKMVEELTKVVKLNESALKNLI